MAAIITWLLYYGYDKSIVLNLYYWNKPLKVKANER
jgi:hypothetical protein